MDKFDSFREGDFPKFCDVVVIHADAGDAAICVILDCLCKSKCPFVLDFIVSEIQRREVFIHKAQ